MCRSHKGRESADVALLQVDCTEQQPLCNEYGVSGYPTLKVFRNGTPVDYAGPRKADGIISYMVKWVSAINDLRISY